MYSTDLVNQKIAWNLHVHVSVPATTLNTRNYPYPRKFALVDILLDVIIPVLSIAFIDGEYLPTLRNLHVRIRENKFTKGLGKKTVKRE